MCIPTTPSLARKYQADSGPIGAMARGYLAGRAGLDPIPETSHSGEYEGAWLDGAGDREFLLTMGRKP